jgi:hypothetical protein
MYQIDDIAEWFLFKDKLNHEKLQCFCYLAYGWYYALNDIELFKTAGFMATGFFPHDVYLFDKYKHYGSRKIKASIEVIFPVDIDVFLISIYDLYKDIDSYALTMIIKKELPYRNALARRLLNPNQEPICFKEDMKKYYLSIYQNG